MKIPWLRILQWAFNACGEVDPTFDVPCGRGFNHDEPHYHRREGRHSTVQWRTDGYKQEPPPPPPRGAR